MNRGREMEGKGKQKWCQGRRGDVVDFKWWIAQRGIRYIGQGIV